MQNESRVALCLVELCTNCCSELDLNILMMRVHIGFKGPSGLTVRVLQSTSGVLKSPATNRYALLFLSKHGWISSSAVSIIKLGYPLEVCNMHILCIVREIF